MSKTNVRVIQESRPYPHELYLPAGEGPFPLVCITPMLGRLAFLEDLFFERFFARYFAANGLATAIMDRNIFSFDHSLGLEQLHDYLSATLSRNQALLDHLLGRGDIDPEKTGSFGMSFGAVANFLWASRDKRLSSHVFVLPGGNIPEIFVASEDPLMRSYLRAALARTGYSKTQLCQALREVFTLDPMEVCGEIDPASILMVLARFDRVIPYRYGKQLREKLGRPETILLPLGHYTSILTIPWLKKTGLNFFKKKWGLKH
ncbi:MAG TPA: hypothetical protein VL688_12265 [Verrucomicrobiae bacterium]|jgi:hypothetical protein|nr:hypothetical protein [Verrucomicrobiae bacterium]